MQLRRIVLCSVLLLLFLPWNVVAAPPNADVRVPRMRLGELPDTFILYEGTTAVGVGFDTLVVTTERTIMLIIDELTLDYVKGQISVLDGASSLVSIYWVRHHVVVFYDLVVGWTDFEYYYTETGHAEKKDEGPRIFEAPPR